MGRLYKSNNTLSQCRLEVATSAVSFRRVSENSGGPLSPLSYPSVRFSSIRYLILSRGVGNALVTPLGLRVSLGRGHHLLPDGSPICLPFEFAIKSVIFIVKTKSL
ncbi:hypothetical protein EVAR_19161_1 [Eumeta japonica]|uniref:Uncharacterized protein n=1 Tax=Eumeta variegata TaxID=151549 RepID=A0A4C1VMV7_EUMVA|nr:hypothetical protein EVAR_19161_1 [Eumeta japonica]